MPEGQQIQFEIIKKVSERTGLSIKLCKTALDNSGYDSNSAILWLRTNNHMEAVSMDKLLEVCRVAAHEMALDFLETTKETGELQKYYSNNAIDTIRDNFYYMFVSDMSTLLSDDMKLLTDDEVDMLDDKREEFYNEAVKANMQNYLK